MRALKGRRIAALGFLCALAVGGIYAGARVQEEIAIRRLSSEDPAARDAAARLLARRGVARAVPALLEALIDAGVDPRSPAPEYRSHAEALEKLMLPRSVPWILDLLRQKDPGAMGSWAARALGRIDLRTEEVLQGLREFILRDETGDEGGIESLLRFGRRAVPVFQEALAQFDYPPYWTRLLSELGPNARKAAPDLVRRLKNHKDFIIESLFVTLGEIDPEAFGSLVCDLFRDPDESFRFEAKLALHSLAVDPELTALVPAAASALRRLLDDADGTTRREAAMALADLKCGTRELLLPIFKEILFDASSEEQGLRYLAGLGWFEPGMLPTLLEALKDEDSCREAARLLAAGGTMARGQVDRFLVELSTLDSETQVRALHALGEAGLLEGAALAPFQKTLEGSLQDVCTSTRAAAATMLLWVDPRHEAARSAVPPAVRSDPSALQLTYFGLSRLARSDRGAFEALLRSWFAGDLPTARAFVRDAFEFGREGLAILIEGARGQDEDLHLDSFAGLDLFGLDASLGPAIVEVLRDPDAELRAWAAYTLGRIEPPGAVPAGALESVLRDPSCAVRWEARRALRQLGRGELLAGFPLSLCSDQSCGRSHVEVRWIERVHRAREEGRLGDELAGIPPEERSRVLSILAEMAVAAREALPWILDRIQDTDEGVPVGAIAALVATGPEATTIPLLLGAWKAADPEFRDRIWFELSAMPPAPEVVSIYLDALDHDFDGARFHAASMLGELGARAEAAVPALIARLRGRRAARAACYVLVRTGPPAVGPLLRALEGADPDTRAWIAFTLGNLGAAAREADPALARLEAEQDSIVRHAAVEARERIAGSRAPSPLIARPNSYRELRCGTGIRDAALRFHESLACSRKKP